MSTSTSGLLTALVLVPLSMGVVGLSRTTPEPAAAAHWAELQALADDIELGIERADWRRPPLAGLVPDVELPKASTRAGQRASSGIPAYRAATGSFDGAQAQALWLELMQASQGLGTAPEAAGREALAAFRELTAEGLREVRRGARASSAHPAYDFDAREPIGVQNLRWLTTGASLRVQELLAAGEPREAVLLVCDMLQVGSDCANLPHMFDFMAGAQVLEVLTADVLLDPAVNGAWPRASLAVLATALARVDAELTELDAGASLADGDIAFTMRALEAQGLHTSPRGRMGAGAEVDALLEGLVELRAWSQDRQDVSLAEVQVELRANETEGAGLIGYAFFERRASALAHVRLARAVVELRLHGTAKPLPSPTQGELELIDGDTLTAELADRWAVSPAAARGRWLLRFPQADDANRPVARALVDKR